MLRFVASVGRLAVIFRTPVWFLAQALRHFTHLIAAYFAQAGALRSVSY
jgi:hypothetical protein